MGTVVFPRAALKIFLTASPEERARRRYKQLKEKDSGVSLAALSLEIAERDRRDMTRSVAPLVPAADAIVLDSTALSAVEVTDEIYAHGRSALRPCAKRWRGVSSRIEGWRRRMRRRCYV